MYMQQWKHMINIYSVVDQCGFTFLCHTSRSLCVHEKVYFWPGVSLYVPASACCHAMIIYGSDILYVDMVGSVFWIRHNKGLIPQTNNHVGPLRNEPDFSK